MPRPQVRPVKARTNLADPTDICRSSSPGATPSSSSPSKIKKKLQQTDTGKKKQPQEPLTKKQVQETPPVKKQKQEAPLTKKNIQETQPISASSRRKQKVEVTEVKEPTKGKKETVSKNLKSPKPTTTLSTKTKLPKSPTKENKVPEDDRGKNTKAFAKSPKKPKKQQTDIPSSKVEETKKERFCVPKKLEETKKVHSSKQLEETKKERFSGPKKLEETKKVHSPATKKFTDSVKKNVEQTTTSPLSSPLSPPRKKKPNPKSSTKDSENQQTSTVEIKSPVSRTKSPVSRTKSPKIVASIEKSQKKITEDVQHKETLPTVTNAQQQTPQNDHNNQSCKNSSSHDKNSSSLVTDEPKERTPFISPNNTSFSCTGPQITEIDHKDSSVPQEAEDDDEFDVDALGTVSDDVPCAVIESNPDHVDEDDDEEYKYIESAHKHFNHLHDDDDDDVNFMPETTLDQHNSSDMEDSEAEGPFERDDDDI